MKRKLYYVLDYYDDYEGDEIGIFDTLEKAQDFAINYDVYQTDGECTIVIKEYENGQFTGIAYGYSKEGTL